MVSANLAVAFSQLLMDVVLIDGDLRRPTLSRVFQQEHQRGLTDILESGGPLSDCVFPTSVERLSILPAGQSKTNPGNLLGKGGFGQVLSDPMLSEKCVVIDTSPLSACSDALLMGVHTDGAVMVVSPEKWQGEPEAHYIQDLEDHGIEVLGAVLNNADPSEQTHGANYGYGYGYEYGYGQEESAPAPKSKLPKILSTLFRRNKMN